MAFLAFIGTILFFIGVIALIKGDLKSLKIENRLAAAGVLVASLIFIVIGAPGAEEDNTPNQQLVEKESEAEEEVEEEPEEEVSMGKQNALGSAESYLRTSAFSKEGLKDQLKFEGYSEEEASYAVNEVDVDWKEQSEKSAESYLEFSSFSRQGLIDQLEYEGFTSSQAEHGADAVGY